VEERLKSNSAMLGNFSLTGEVTHGRDREKKGTKNLTMGDILSIRQCMRNL
jgi:hypothetical protein